MSDDATKNMGWIFVLYRFNRHSSSSYPSGLKRCATGTVLTPMKSLTQENDLPRVEGFAEVSKLHLNDTRKGFRYQ